MRKKKELNECNKILETEKEEYNDGDEEEEEAHFNYCAHIYIYLQNMLIKTSYNEHFANEKSVWSTKYVDMNSCAICQYNISTLV